MTEYITRRDVDEFKREMLESSVLVTLEVAAAILSTTPKTVKRIMEEGHLTPHDRTGRITQGVRFRIIDINRYVGSIRVK